MTDAADEDVIVAMETEQLLQMCPSEQQYNANTGDALHGAGLWQTRYDKSHRRRTDGGIYISFSTNQEMVKISSVYCFLNSSEQKGSSLRQWMPVSLKKKNNLQENPEAGSPRRHVRLDLSSLQLINDSLPRPLPQRHALPQRAYNVCCLSTVLYYGAEGRGAFGGHAGGGAAIIRSVWPHQECAAIYGVLPLLGGRGRDRNRIRAGIVGL